MSCLKKNTLSLLGVEKKYSRRKTLERGQTINKCWVWTLEMKSVQTYQSLENIDQECIQLMG